MPKRKMPSRAVIETRAPHTVETDTPEQALFRKLDFFCTPPWSARAIAHRLKQFDPGAATVYDPMCGQGHFTGPLIEVFGKRNVMASDIYDFGAGEHFDVFEGVPSHFNADWWVTNPAFPRAADLIQLGLQKAARGVIVLSRTAFVESEGREQMLYEGENPLTCFMPFVERVPMILGRYDPEASTASSYSCFVFHKGRSARAHQPFMSGTKARYFDPTDPAKYALPMPLPLFEKVALPGMLRP